MKNNILFLSIFFAGLSIVFTQPLFCANITPRSEEEKRIEQEKREALEKTEAPLVAEKGKTWSIEKGGWFTSLYVYNSEDDNDRRTKDLVRNASYQDLRLWGKLAYKQLASVYLRIKDIYVQRDASDDYTGVGSDNSGPSLDLGYINISLNDFTKTTSNLIIGRQYLSLGRAIAYNDVNDGVQVTAGFSKWNIKAFAAQTRSYEDNIDYSVPGYDKHGDRFFYAAQLDYVGIKNYTIYAYYLIQRDRAKPTPADSTQIYTYNSEYYSLGFTGKVYKEKIDYWAEAIKETGKDYTDASVSALTKTNIDGWGFDCGAAHRFNCWTHPTLDFEYAFGSGDNSRTKVDVTKDGGNISGNDTNFLYFGGIYAGYALAPRLSNIHIYKLGASFIPFEETKIGGNIICGLKYYYYVKAKSQGGISDLEAVENNSNIGQEVDIYTYWKATSNTYLSARGGIFFPGDAYPSTNNDHETYVLLSLTTAF